MAKKPRDVEMVPHRFITVENLMHYDKVKAYLDKEEADEYFLTQEEADALYLAIDGHITLTEEQKEELRGKDGKDGQNGIFFTPVISEDFVLTWDALYLAIDGHITLTEEQKEELRGKDGKDGQNGIFFTPVISEDFVLTWTNNGDLDNPDPIDLKGKDGKDGVYLGIVEHEKTASDTVAELAPNEVYKFPEDLDNPDPIDLKGKDGKDGVYLGIVEHEKTASDTVAELAPNEVYKFPEMATLTITLGTGTSMFDEYHFFFTSGATATVLSIPAEISVPDDFEVEANMRYEISIAENILIYLARDIAVQTEGSGGEA